MAITNKHIIDQNRTIHLWANHGVWAKYGKFILVYKSNSIYIYMFGMMTVWGTSPTKIGSEPEKKT